MSGGDSCDLLMVNFPDSDLTQVAIDALAQDLKVVAVGFSFGSRGTGSLHGFIKTDRLCSLEKALHSAATLRGNPAVSFMQLERAIEASFRDFSRQLDRVLIRPVSVSYRASFHFALCQYWLSQLQDFRPRAVVFCNSPHFPWDTCLYHCAEALDIPVFTFSATHLNGVGRVHRGLGNGPRSALRFDLSQQYVADSELLFAELRRVSSRIEKSIQINRRLGDQGQLRRLRYEFARHARRVLPETSPPSLPYVPFGRRELFRQYSQHAKAVAALRRELDSVSTPVPEHGRWVYLALHYQPEQSTDPEAGLFSDQLLTAHLVRAALPTEVALVIKEHPRQLLNYSPDIRTAGYRHGGFYESLASMENTHVIDPLTDPNLLIDRSVAVVTSTGSTGWSALLSGVPALLLADAWYSECSSSPWVEDLEHLDEAFGLIRTKDPSEVGNDLRAFLSEPSGELLRIAIDDVYAKSSVTSRAELSRNLEQVVRALLES